MGDTKFNDLLDHLRELHDRKAKDYGKDGDPLANVRASEAFGVPSWIGSLIRLNDKVIRLQQFAKRGSLANESAEDSMLDIAVYALITLILYREQKPAVQSIFSPEDFIVRPFEPQQYAEYREGE